MLLLRWRVNAHTTMHTYTDNLVCVRNSDNLLGLILILCLKLKQFILFFIRYSCVSLFSSPPRTRLNLCFESCAAITFGAGAAASAAVVTAIASLCFVQVLYFFFFIFGIRIILIISTILLKSAICRHHLWCALLRSMFPLSLSFPFFLSICLYYMV